MYKKIATLCLVSLFFASSSYAAILFTPSVTYLEQSLADNANPETKAKLTLIDLRLGYVMDFGLYLGGLYSIHDQDMLADSSDSYFGPSVGYYNSGFLIVGTYYLYGERDLTNGVGKYAGAKGYQLDISYSVPITKSISMGPQLTYHTVEFDEIQSSGNSSPTDYSFSGISPYFNLTFIF